MTAYATVRITDSLCVNEVEISYAEVQAMIDILTEGRIHDEDPADEKIMPDLLRNHVRDTVYANYQPLSNVQTRFVNG